MPITRTWSARDTGSDRALRPFPFCLADSIRTSSNMQYLPARKTPRLAGRFRRGRHRQGFLSQFQCLREVAVRRVGELLLFGRIRVDLGLLAVEEVQIRERFEILGTDLERLVEGVDTLVDDAPPLVQRDVGEVVGPVP